LKSFANHLQSLTGAFLNIEPKLRSFVFAFVSFTRHFRDAISVIASIAPIAASSSYPATRVIYKKSGKIILPLLFYGDGLFFNVSFG
jgi:hypothetical protein